MFDMSSWKAFFDPHNERLTTLGIASIVIGAVFLFLVVPLGALLVWWLQRRAVCICFFRSIEGEDLDTPTTPRLVLIEEEEEDL